MSTEENLKYPIGKMPAAPAFSEVILEGYTETICSFPKLLRAKVYHLNKEQLAWPYRPEGWTIAQVVHHCADSHMNALMRIKLALTEKVPTIKPYEQDAWSKLVDNKINHLAISLNMLDALHAKWTILMEHIRDDQIKRSVFHPELKKELTVFDLFCQYDWHCRHHLAHVVQGVESYGKYV